MALSESTAEAIRAFPALRADGFRAMLALAIRRDTLFARYAMLSAIAAYLDDGGLSRGSYLAEGRAGIDREHAGSVLETALKFEDGTVSAESRFVPVRPIPETDNWFEDVYNAYGGSARFRAGSGENAPTAEKED